VVLFHVGFFLKKGEKYLGGKSALIQAVVAGDKRQIELLLSEDGVDVNKRDNEDEDGRFLINLPF